MVLCLKHFPLCILASFSTFPRTLSSSLGPVRCVLPVYTHTCVMFGAHISQEGIDPVQLEIGILVNYHLGAWNQNWVLCKSKCF